MTTIIAPHLRNIGFPIKRLLPSAQMQRIGPFIFFDHMGPSGFEPNTTEGDVRPHPHIGLATVTYLFSGAIMHRDSLGMVQRIDPGAINLMTAGRGVVHSERIPTDVRDSGTQVQGIQTWLALPEQNEESAPGFAHYESGDLPVFSQDGVTAKILIGSAFGLTSPVETAAPTTYVDLHLSADVRHELRASNEERAIYLVGGKLRVNDTDVPLHHMFVLDRNTGCMLQTDDRSAHVLLLGGQTLPGARHINWNFVSSRPERIDQARDDWKNGRFDRVPGETEWIPLP